MTRAIAFFEWTGLLVNCITTVWYAIKINTGKKNQTAGLRISNLNNVMLTAKQSNAPTIAGNGDNMV